MQEVKIKSIKRIEKKDRYDITVPHTHNFFANGILIHNSSGVSSKILCKRKLSLLEKVAKFLGVKVVTETMDYIYSSRRVIKNLELNPNAQHFYSTDIWGLAHETLKDYLLDGMTFYYEIVGYLPDGKQIQKGYDYGCDEGKFNTFIYRITYTNPSGNVFEFSARQVQDWCKERGINVVPELFYGKASEIVPFDEKVDTLDSWRDKLLAELKSRYLEKDCYLNKTFTKSPDEGIVLKIENGKSGAFKLKSERFYLFETKMLDSGEEDIEEAGE